MIHIPAERRADVREMATKLKAAIGRCTRQNAA